VRHAGPPAAGEFAVEAIGQVVEQFDLPLFEDGTGPVLPEADPEASWRYGRVDGRILRMRCGEYEGHSPQGRSACGPPDRCDACLRHISRCSISSI